MLSHKDLRDKMLRNPDVQKKFAKQEEEFSLFDQLIKARAEAGLIQSEVAERMGAKTPAVARLESGSGMKNHSPSISTLCEYASPDFSPAEVAVDARREARCYSSLCALLRQRCRHGKIGWPLVNIVYDFHMKEYYSTTSKYQMIYEN